MNPKLTVDRLRRRAVVYVRQSSPGQVLHHLESQRLQYGLVERARQLGFADVQAVCSGEVGAVFCLEASRLARNGREWHRLFELCGLVDAVIVDGDGVYDPTLTNDRLLLGLKRLCSYSTSCSTFFASQRNKLLSGFFGISSLHRLSPVCPVGRCSLHAGW